MHGLTIVNKNLNIQPGNIGIAFIGIFAFSKLGIDLLPNISLPHLIVQTTYQNSNPEEIEKLITEPLESTIGTVTGVKRFHQFQKKVVPLSL